MRFSRSPGQSLTTLGKGDLVPTTSFYRVLAVFAATIGLSVITVTLTYLVEVYTALQARNTYALSLHHASGNTGDAAELIAGLGAGGDFEDARGELSRLGTELVNLYESHHFYTSLIHFRFRESFYAVPRVALVTMELATLIASALDARRYAFLRDSAQVKRLWCGGMHLLEELSRVFLPGGPAGECRAQPATRERWRRRYDHALLRLREAGIETSEEPDEGFSRYVELREKWTPTSWPSPGISSTPSGRWSRRRPASKAGPQPIPLLTSFQVERHLDRRSRGGLDLRPEL